MIRTVWYCLTRHCLAYPDDRISRWEMRIKIPEERRDNWTTVESRNQFLADRLLICMQPANHPRFRKSFTKTYECTDQDRNVMMPHVGRSTPDTVFFNFISFIYPVLCLPHPGWTLTLCVCVCVLYPALCVCVCARVCERGQDKKGKKRNDNSLVLTRTWVCQCVCRNLSVTLAITQLW